MGKLVGSIISDVYGVRVDAGVIVPVVIGVTAALSEALRNAGKVVPAGRPCRAFVDTGAELTYVHTRVIRQMGIETTGDTATSRDLRGNVTGYVKGYAVSIAIEGDDAEVIAYAGDDDQPGTIDKRTFEVLLGRSFLKYCRFSWDGPGDQFSLSV